MFGLGEKLSDDEEKLIRPLVWAAEKAAMLNNDYWSWDIEYFQANQKVDNLTNAVAVLMRKEGISAREGKNRIKDLIVGYEAEYLRLRAQFYDNHPSARLYLSKRVELAGSMAAGVSYWSANSPRYRLPTKQAQPIDIGEETAAKTNDTPQRSVTPSSASTENDDLLDTTSGNATDNTSQTSQSEEPTKRSEFDVPKLGPSAINEPIDYVSGMPSKGVRTSLIDAMNQWCQVPSAQLAAIKRVIDLLHTSSLILDDIQDESPMRRGKTATHLIFGEAQSINSATFLYVRAVQEVQPTGNAALMAVLLEELEDLHVGQSWDLYWKYNMEWPTEDEYFSMIDLKTGGLFRMLVRMMQAVSPRSNAGFVCDALVSMISRFFQVRDDYMNLNSREYSNQKGWCEDLDEGKFSYLIIHCLENSPKLRNRIMGLFRQRNRCSGPMPSVAKVQIIEYLQEVGSFEACWELLNRLEDEIESEIRRLEDITGEENPQIHLLLKLLSVKNSKPSKGAVVVPFGV